MFPMEITGAGGAHAARGLGGRRARAPRHHRPRLPVAVRDVRAEHEHLGRLDHRLPGGAGRLHPPGARSTSRDRGAAAIDVRPEVEAATRPRGAGALRGHRVDALRLLVPRRQRPDRRQLARLHARVRAGRGSSTRRPSPSCRRRRLRPVDAVTSAAPVAGGATSCGRRAGSSTPGTSTSRTTVASSAIATAPPSAIIWIAGIPVAMNEAKTATMIAAALVIVAALDASPSATAPRLSPVSSKRSRTRESRNTS